MNQVSPKKVGILLGTIVALILTFKLGGELVETNNQGYYQVKQAAFTGEMTVRNTSGTYAQNFGKITTYHVSDMLYFSESNLDGGKGEETDAITVQFNGGGTAKVSGTLKFRLSTKEEDQLNLHRDFKSYESVKHDLVRQVVQEALTKTAALMKAEDSYSTRLSDFTRMAEDQIVYGLYDTISHQIKQKDAEGNELVDTVVEYKLGTDGKKIVYKPSPFIRYNMEVINFTIKGFSFDEKTKAIIAAKQDAEQAKVVARANAERAKQDSITTFEQGKARVAKAEADALVEKKTAVINAERETEVAKQEAQKAIQEALATVSAGKASAEIARLKVQAGLTPLERATIEKETAIGVAHELAGVQFPQMMILGGEGKNGSADPFQAVGLESFMRINEKLSTTRPERKVRPSLSTTTTAKPTTRNTTADEEL